MKDTPKGTVDVLIPPTLPIVDHGIDIIGDEWDEEDEEPEMPNMEYEQRNDPDHPYCTNWPMNKKKEKEDENV